MTARAISRANGGRCPAAIIRESSCREWSEKPECLTREIDNIGIFRTVRAIIGFHDDTHTSLRDVEILPKVHTTYGCRVIGLREGIAIRGTSSVEAIRVESRFFRESISEEQIRANKKNRE